MYYFLPLFLLVSMEVLPNNEPLNPESGGNMNEAIARDDPGQGCTLVSKYLAFLLHQLESQGIQEEQGEVTSIVWVRDSSGNVENKVDHSGEKKCLLWKINNPTALGSRENYLHQRGILNHTLLNLEILVGEYSQYMQMFTEPAGNTVRFGFTLDGIAEAMKAIHLFRGAEPRQQIDLSVSTELPVITNHQMRM